ncbi:MAG: hypothetical protein QM729_21140 [Solirubrobacterales bacterium]
MRSPDKSPRRLPVAPTIVALLVILTAALALASSAGAQARFTYEMCDWTLPGGNPLTLHFVSNTGVAYTSVDSCDSTAGWVGIEQTGSVTENFAYLETSVPPTPEGWVESLTMTGFANGFHGNGGRIGEGSWPSPGSGESTSYIFANDERPTCTFDPFAERYGGVCGDYAFDVYLTCGGTCEGGATIGARFFAALEVDPTPPKVKGVEGPLLAGGVIRGHQEVKATATDVGGGLTSLELRVDGISVPGTKTGSCSTTTVDNPSFKGVVADSPTPCPTTLTNTWDVDTGAAPFRTGDNTVEVCASDFATIGSPNTTCSTPQTVDVDDTCTESGVTGGQDISAGFARDGSDETTVRYGHGAEVDGSLTDDGGEPVSGATICMESQPASSTSEASKTVATATTDAHGDFTLKVGPGANRRLLIGYRHDSFQVGRRLSVSTHARPILKLSAHDIRGGTKVTFTGRLPRPSPGGRVLVFQGSSAHGDDWLTFRKVTTGPNGGFSAGYRFSRPATTTTYRVRVVAPRQAGYEYDPGASRALRITVRP